MSNHKNKFYGFTLIELLVVVSIISLLSSIVLASLKDAREKAKISKAIQDLKQLQIAVELYKESTGNYIGYNDVNSVFSSNANTTNSGSSIIFRGGLDTKLQPLVDLNLISEIPKSFKNCSGMNNYNCSLSGFVFGYATLDANDKYYYECGGKKISNYVIYFMTNSKKLNLSNFIYNNDGEYYNVVNISDANTPPDFNPPYVYCLSN